MTTTKTTKTNAARSRGPGGAPFLAALPLLLASCVAVEDGGGTGGGVIEGMRLDFGASGAVPSAGGSPPTEPAATSTPALAPDGALVPDGAVGVLAWQFKLADDSRVPGLPQTGGGSYAVTGGHGGISGRLIVNHEIREAMLMLEGVSARPALEPGGVSDLVPQCASWPSAIYAQEFGLAPAGPDSPADGFGGSKVNLVLDQDMNLIAAGVSLAGVDANDLVPGMEESYSVDGFSGCARTTLFDGGFLSIFVDLPGSGS